jgi:hypothetical protein
MQDLSLVDLTQHELETFRMEFVQFMFPEKPIPQSVRRRMADRFFGKLGDEYEDRGEISVAIVQQTTREIGTVVRKLSLRSRGEKIRGDIVRGSLQIMAAMLGEYEDKCCEWIANSSEQIEEAMAWSLAARAVRNFFIDLSTKIHEDGSVPGPVLEALTEAIWVLLIMVFQREDAGARGKACDTRLLRARVAKLAEAAAKAGLRIEPEMSYSRSSTIQQIYFDTLARAVF